MKGSANYVAWKVQLYKILWKRKGVAESYHSATSVEELKKDYKDKVAFLCNEKDSDWEMDKIVLD